MNIIQQFLVGVVGLAVVTTLVLPKRQTPAVINAFANFTSRTIGTAMGATRTAK